MMLGFCFFFFFNGTATTEIYTSLFVGSVRCVYGTGQAERIAAVSMGNPHAVLSVADVATAPVAELGAALESHPRFPNRVNVGFMQIVDRSDIKLRVFERGVGETEACGSGACAAAVAAIQQDLVDSPVTVHLTRGSLKIDWKGSGHALIMSGPAKTVFHGRIRI